MKKNLNVTVTGKVQGVFYRSLTREKAKALGVKGYVRNLKDGSVFIEMEGQEDSLHELINWCKDGPERASVDDIAVKDGQPKGFQKFEIIY